MSRIGKQPVALASNIEFTIGADRTVTVKGEKGTGTIRIHPDITVEKNDTEIIVKRPSDSKEHKSLHGLYRSLIYNMVEGVTHGYKKTLEIIGVGYRATYSNGVLELNLGFSHPIYFVPPEGIDIEVDTKTKKNPMLIISGVNKEMVGQVAAKIRSMRKPEPYKGKGIRYTDEHVRRKAGKSASK
ncbi:50S ribosomal protein L6 [soil metagenome]